MQQRIRVLHQYRACVRPQPPLCRNESVYHHLTHCHATQNTTHNPVHTHGCLDYIPYACTHAIRASPQRPPCGALSHSQLHFPYPPERMSMHVLRMLGDSGR